MENKRGNEKSVEPNPKKFKEFKQFPTLTEPITTIPSEDEQSSLRHNIFIISEENKKNPNINAIALLMRKTFAYRRQQILESFIPVCDILKTYPSLRRIDQVRIGNWPNFLKNAHLKDESFNFNGGFCLSCVCFHA